MKNYYFFTEPPTDPTLLFILTPEHIFKIVLPPNTLLDSEELENPSPAILTQVLKLKNVITMEVNFMNRTVCVLENFDIFCYNVSNFMDKWKMPAPDFFPLYEGINDNFLYENVINFFHLSLSLSFQ